MPTIRIDEDVWRYLQSKAKPFEDSPNDVLRREVGLMGGVARNRGFDAPEGTKSDPDRGLNGQRHADSLKPDKDYTHHRVRGFRVDGRYFPSHSFKEVLVNMSNHLRGSHRSHFDKAALGLRGKKRVYFSQSPQDLKSPEQLSGNGLFVETNLNANLIVGICRKLLEKLGHDLGKFDID